LTSAQQSAAVASAAEKLSSRHVLPRDLSNALKQLDDGELDRLFAATRHELQRRGRLLTSTPVNRPTTHMGAEQRASDQSTTTEESAGRRQSEAPNVALTQGQVNAVRATFKAGIAPSRIARQFGISQSDVRKVLASESRRSGKGR
jgi:catalase